MRSFNPVLLSALALTLGAAPQRRPPNDLWPVRSYDDIRPGCHVLVSACWASRPPHVGPREDFDPLWEELINWLAQSPVLTDIETFWVFDADHGHGWQLLVTGMPEAERAGTVRVPTGTMVYDEAPLVRVPEREVADHGYVDVRVELSPEDADALRRQQGLRQQQSAGYEIRQRPLLINYVSRMPDDSLETVVDGRVVGRGRDIMEIAREPEDMSGFDATIERLRGIAPLSGRVVATRPCVGPRIYRDRDQQRESRKRRADRKRKRGWA